jgi:hypothetical protein
MELLVKIEMGNDAFAGNMAGEAARQLRELALKLDQAGEIGPRWESFVQDLNGNTTLTGWVAVLEYPCPPCTLTSS